MFFIYFPSVFVLSIIVYIDSENYEMPKWWSALVLFAPLTIPYYIVKTRGKNSIIPLVLFVVICAVVSVGESFLYSRAKEKIIYANYSPEVRDVLKVVTLLKDSSEHLNKYITVLQDINRVDSTVEKINETIDFIADIRSAIEEHHKIVNRFIIIVNDYRDTLINEKFDWIIKIEEYYNESVINKYITYLNAYLDEFSSLLKYTSKNLDGINSRNPTTLQSYDIYYINYVRALESHNRIEISRVQFQRNFTAHNPSIEPYLISIIKNPFVNVWKK